MKRIFSSLGPHELQYRGRSCIRDVVLRRPGRFLVLLFSFFPPAEFQNLECYKSIRQLNIGASYKVMLCSSVHVLSIGAEPSVRPGWQSSYASACSLRRGRYAFKFICDPSSQSSDPDIQRLADDLGANPSPGFLPFSFKSLSPSVFRFRWCVAVVLWGRPASME